MKSLPCAEVSGEIYFPALARFDISLAHVMWIFDNVRAGSSVLDIGCAGAMLGVLKRKDARLTGVAPTAQRALAARANGYDAACAARPTRLPFPDASFDYAVSLDLLDQSAGEETNATLAEIKRVLRIGGTLLHVAARHGAAARGDENGASLDEGVSASPRSGHDGENSNFREAQAALLRPHFAHVASRPRDALCLSGEEFLREAHSSGFPVEEDFLDYLRGLSFRERRAFDMAMGYVHDKIAALGVGTPKNEFYIFVKASDEPFSSFDNEHRDRRSLLKRAATLESNSACLDRDEGAEFDDGWLGTRDLPPRARLMSERGRVRFAARGKPERIRLDLTTHMPDLNPRGLALDLFVNDRRACSFTLFRYGWLELEVTLPPAAADGRYELEIRADRTWAASDDGRRFSIAVCNLEVIMKDETKESGVRSQESE